MKKPVLKPKRAVRGRPKLAAKPVAEITLRKRMEDLESSVNMLFDRMGGRIAVAECVVQDQGKRLDKLEVRARALKMLPTIPSATKMRVRHAGWTNIYPAMAPESRILSLVYKSREEADKASKKDRIACLYVEWFE